MADPTIQAVDGIWQIGKWLFVFVLGMLGFNLKRVITKVDEHDKNHVSRTELNDTVKTMRKENREDFKDLRDKVDKLLDRD